MLKDRRYFGNVVFASTFVITLSLLVVVVGWLA
jgi:hypothetical protein